MGRKVVVSAHSGAPLGEPTPILKDFDQFPSIFFPPGFYDFFKGLCNLCDL